MIPSNTLLKDHLQDVCVCFKAFISLHGTITDNEFDQVKEDGRRKHSNRPKKLTIETFNNVMEFIRSFKGRKSHYSLKDTSKIYLLDELNVSKIHLRVSYMECDKNMSLIKQKAYTETPKDWRDVIQSSRIKPKPFIVVNCGEEITFHGWTKFLTSRSTMAVQVLFFTRILMLTYSQNLLFYLLQQKHQQQLNFKRIYIEQLPIQHAKLKDLLYLTKFLRTEGAKNFYKSLISDGDNEEQDQVEYVDNPPVDE
ncbi:hypothetical protein ABEB36_004727 [Hypothenemus hampei]|uniref:Uncharacterized protein n=1 Tax=Hypothenemus hampei TaxID=57062 RepID=A0ABD1F485_HYPHA